MVVTDEVDEVKSLLFNTRSEFVVERNLPTPCKRVRQRRLVLLRQEKRRTKREGYVRSSESGHEGETLVWDWVGRPTSR